jgi:hypothetical protein
MEFSMKLFKVLLIVWVSVVLTYVSLTWLCSEQIVRIYIWDELKVDTREDLLILEKEIVMQNLDWFYQNREKEIVEYELLRMESAACRFGVDLDGVEKVRFEQGVRSGVKLGGFYMKCAFLGPEDDWKQFKIE